MSAPSFTYSGNVYTAGVAGTVDFPLTSTTGNAIPYLEPSHIHVYTSADSGATWTELTRPAQWDFASSGTVARLVTGIAAGEWVKVQRITPSLSSYVTFQASSLLTAEQLNSDTLCNTYLNQEGIDQGDQATLTAEGAVTTANAATATANAATATANAATSTANAASSDASTALSQSNSALADSATALSNSATALSQSNSALSASASAVSDAAAAVSTANSADAKADSAITAISTSAVFTPVANVAAIPASPTAGQSIQVTDSTGIESFSPLANIPGGFVGDSGLAVRIQYNAGASTWNWFGYFAVDSDSRYFKTSGSVITSDGSGGAAAPGLTFTGDTDTGIASLGANEIGIVTNGVARLTFDSSGAGNFTSPVTIPAGSTVTGYLDSATAASTYLTQANAASTYQTQAGMTSYVATADIGVTVQGYDADTAKLDVAQLWTATQSFAGFQLVDADGSNWVQLKAPDAVASNVTFALPSGDGAAGQSLVTNGAGQLGWSDGGGVKLAQAYFFSSF